MSALPEEDILQLDYEDDNEKNSELLISEEDKDGDSVFIPSAQAAKSIAASGSWGEDVSTPASPAPSMDMYSVCKLATSRLNITWPALLTDHQISL